MSRNEAWRRRLTVVPVSLLGTIEKGSTLRVFPEEPIGGELTAQVEMVERVIDAPSGTFGVRLTLPNADGVLPAGLRCKLDFER